VDSGTLFSQVCRLQTCSFQSRFSAREPMLPTASVGIRAGFSYFSYRDQPCEINRWLKTRL